MEHRTQAHPTHAGAALVEFALVLMVLLAFILGVVEAGRAVLVWNVLAQATGRAARGAALTNPGPAAGPAQTRLREAAMLLGPGQLLPLGGGIGADDLLVEYLGPDGTTPVDIVFPCPADNLAVCLSDPDSPGCIRFVRVRLCRSGPACSAVPYAPLTGLPVFAPLQMSLPRFEAVVPAQSLGTNAQCAG